MVLATAAPVGGAERILALAPHIVETLYHVGAGDQIVGAVRFSDFPPAARELPRIGSYKGISVEAAVRLRPTVAVAPAASVEGLRELEDFGVEILISHPRTVLEVIADIERLGRRFGRGAEAAEAADRLRQRLTMLRRNRPQPSIRVFYEVWHEPLITAGEGSFITDALSQIGAENVFGAVPFESPRVNVEAVVRAAPDAVVIPGEARDVEERKGIWRSWMSESTVMVEAHHDLLHRAGPRLFDGLELLQGALLKAIHDRQMERLP